MTKLLQAIVGILIAVIGLGIIIAASATIILAKAVTMWAVIFLAIGAMFLFWGGVMIPNSGVEDGAHKLSIFVGPLLDYLPGGRRKTDPPSSPGPTE